MTLKTLKQKVSGLRSGEDRGVSPVIGIVLMVAITVVLAAVIGAFVMGMGDELGDSTPTASVSSDIIDADTGDHENVRFTHTSGDSIDPDDLRIVYDGERVELDGYDDNFGSGSTIDVDKDTTANIDDYTGTVSLVFDDGDSSVNLASAEVDNEDDAGN